MTAREKLAALLAPDALDALEGLVAEKVEERIRTGAAAAIRKRQRPELLSVAEAADLLRAKPQRVYDLVSSGRLTKLKDGSRVLIRRTEVETYLNGKGA